LIECVNFASVIATRAWIMPEIVPGFGFMKTCPKCGGNVETLKTTGTGRMLYEHFCEACDWSGGEDEGPTPDFSEIAATRPETTDDLADFLQQLLVGEGAEPELPVLLSGMRFELAGLGSNLDFAKLADAFERAWKGAAQPQPSGDTNPEILELLDNMVLELKTLPPANSMDSWLATGWANRTSRGFVGAMVRGLEIYDADDEEFRQADWDLVDSMIMDGKTRE
jgi:hypothetical protein